MFYSSMFYGSTVLCSIVLCSKVLIKYKRTVIPNNIFLALLNLHFDYISVAVFAGEEIVGLGGF